MAKYEVKHKVEINGTVYEPGVVLNPNVFRPPSGKLVPVWKQEKIDLDGRQEIKHFQDGEEPEKGELESLLGTGHVVEVA